MSFLIIFVSLSLLVQINLFSGASGEGQWTSENLCEPSNPTKSNCLQHGCLCAWCPSPVISESHRAGELSEDNKDGGSQGTCFIYDDNPKVNRKRCGNMNATISTHGDSRYCKNVHSGIYVFVYLVIGLFVGGILLLCFWGATRSLRNQR